MKISKLTCGQYRLLERRKNFFVSSETTQTPHEGTCEWAFVCSQPWADVKTYDGVASAEEWKAKVLTWSETISFAEMTEVSQQITANMIEIREAQITTENSGVGEPVTNQTGTTLCSGSQSVTATTSTS